MGSSAQYDAALNSNGDKGRHLSGSFSLYTLLYEVRTKRGNQHVISFAAGQVDAFVSSGRFHSHSRQRTTRRETTDLHTLGDLQDELA